MKNIVHSYGILVMSRLHVQVVMESAMPFENSIINRMCNNYGECNEGYAMSQQYYKQYAVVMKSTVYMHHIYIQHEQ